MSDRETKTLLSTLTVPFAVTLEPGDVAAAAPPPTFVVAVPRHSCLASLWEPLKSHFKPHVASFGGSGDAFPLWLEHKGVPLPWQYPAGIVADRCSLSVPSATGVAPVPLVAHVGPPPKKSHVVPLQTTKDCQVLVQQNLKASLAVMHEDTRPFFKLSAKKTLAVVNTALAVNVADATGEAAENLGEAWDDMLRQGGDVLAWPVTAHVVQVGPPTAAIIASAEAAGNATSLAPTVAIERVAPASVPYGDAKTYGDLLRVVLGARLADTNLPSVGAASPNEPLAHPQRTVRVFANGTSPLLSTPVEWVMQHLRSVDGALHLLVVSST
jgi:hypothetical protein